jgi:hypothetical protein
MAPIDGVGARRSPVEPYELAEPDPDRKFAAAETGRERHALRQNRLAAPLGPGGDLIPVAHLARRDVDDSSGNLRPADVYTDGERHGTRMVVLGRIAL